MTILYIDHYAGTPELGMEHRPYELARCWVRRGHRVVIVSAGFSHLRQKNPSPGRPMLRSREGVELLYLPTPAYRGRGFSRARNVAAFVGQLWRYGPAIAKKLRPDLVIASSTYPFDAAPARRIAALAGAKTVFELHDLWPLSLTELYGYGEQDLLMQWVRREEHHAMERADLVVSLLPGLGRYFEEEGLHPKKWIPIPNGVRPEQAMTDSPQSLSLRDCRERGCFSVLYAGGLSGANAMESFVRAAAAREKNTAFFILGDGPEKPGLRELARSLKAKDLFFLEPVSHKELFGVLTEADCLYLGAENSRLYQYGISMNKLFDYLLAGRPILCGVDAPENPVSLSGAGLILRPESPEAILEGVRTLRGKTEEERAAMGQRGREYVLAHHRWEDLANRFLEAVKGEES